MLVARARARIESRQSTHVRASTAAVKPHRFRKFHVRAIKVPVDMFCRRRLKFSFCITVHAPRETEREEEEEERKLREEIKGDKQEKGYLHRIRNKKIVKKNEIKFGGSIAIDRRSLSLSLSPRMRNSEGMRREYRAFPYDVSLINARSCIRRTRGINDGAELVANRVIHCNNTLLPRHATSSAVHLPPTSLSGAFASTSTCNRSRAITRHRSRRYSAQFLPYRNARNG